jgi:hypothetical protein
VGLGLYTSLDKYCKRILKFGGKYESLGHYTSLFC